MKIELDFKQELEERTDKLIKRTRMSVLEKGDFTLLEHLLFEYFKDTGHYLKGIHYEDMSEEEHRKLFNLTDVVWHGIKKWKEIKRK